MKKILTTLLLVLVAATFAATAGAQKGVPATTLIGGKGVLAPDGTHRYVALTTGRQTLVSVVRVHGGQVVRWLYVRGFVGVPVVGEDGTTDGISRDGRTLVLAGTPEGRPNDRVVTSFAVVDTASLRFRRVTLPGTWAYDAISPDGTILYLIEYENYGRTPTYRVRAYDLAARRLLSRPIVDRTIGERLMRGWAVTRATNSTGRWAYTLYARQGSAPFVHALDTVQQRAYCVDLPLELRRPGQMRLRLVLRAGELAVRSAGETVAVVDTRSFVVQRR